MLGFIIIAILVGIVGFVFWNRSKSKKQFQNVYNSLDSLNRRELKSIIDDLIYSLPLADNPNERVDANIRAKYGCITRADASLLYDAAVERSNAMLAKDKKVSERKSQKNMESLTDSEKQSLKKLEHLDVTETAYAKALRGDAEAMLFMGMTYDLDLKNPKKAFYWMQKADAAGSLQAKYFLGTYYGSGYGVEENKIKGMDMIFSAAREGNKDAIEFCTERLNMSEAEMRNVGISV